LNSGKVLSWAAAAIVLLGGGLSAFLSQQLDEAATLFEALLGGTALSVGAFLMMVIGDRLGPYAPALSLVGGVLVANVIGIGGIGVDALTNSYNRVTGSIDFPPMVAIPLTILGASVLAYGWIPSLQALIAGFAIGYVTGIKLEELRLRG
jgi:hypothetical protein